MLQDNDGQILLELPGVKEHQRVRELLQRSANLEFYECYGANEITGQFAQLDNALRSKNGNGLRERFLMINNDATPVLGIATAKERRPPGKPRSKTIPPLQPQTPLEREAHPGELQRHRDQAGTPD